MVEQGGSFEDLALSVTRLALANAGSDAIRAVMKRRGVKADKTSTLGPVGALHDHLDALSLQARTGLLTEVLVEGLRDKYCDGPGVKTWRALQRLAGIDVQEPESKVFVTTQEEESACTSD